MHELSIADSILRIAESHADGRPVERVHVKVGHLRQVVPSSLLFAFDLVAAGTALDGAELVIEEVPAVVRCHACAAETAQEGFPLSCGACAGLHVEVVRGEELLVDALDLDVVATNDGRTHGG